MRLALALALVSLGAAPRWLEGPRVQTSRAVVRLFAEADGPVTLAGLDGGCVLHERVAHCTLEPPLGRTQVVLADDAGASTLELWRSDVLDARVGWPAGTAFGDGTLHRPELEARCVGCHASLDAGAPATSAGCRACHGDLLERRYTHGPVAKGECLACHSTSDGATRLGVRWPIQETCFKCHVDISAAMQSKAVRHGPAAAGRCTTCHDPHGSPTPFWLRRDAYSLCTNCHAEKARERHVVVGFAYGDTHPLRDRPHPLKPGQTFACPGCHNPHAAASRFLFQFDVTRREDLCTLCHAK